MINKNRVEIVAVVGPKGGVGKTSISANLAIALAKQGKRVVAVDLDLGASNLNTFLGIRNPKYTLDDFVLNKVGKLEDIVLEINVKGGSPTFNNETSIDNIGFICGGNIPGIANLHYSKKMKLLRNLSMLEYDFVLLDLGAGASHNVVDFVLVSQKNLLVTTPEVPSILNTYSFLKTLVFRKLNIAFKELNNQKAIDLLEKAKDVDKNPQFKKMSDFITIIESIEGGVEASQLIRKTLLNLKPTMLLNRIRTVNDEKAGIAIQNLTREYLGIEFVKILHVHEDSCVGNAIARMRPVMIDNPLSIFASQINSIAMFLLRNFNSSVNMVLKRYI
ncbi:MAG: AAA family ATPase [Desulfamplus sp.]|nr:AAA family ATPase [Desulfamplus sp.]